MTLRLVVFVFMTLHIITVRCKKEGSLTFVIDDTDSMDPVIEQVKHAVDRIMDIVLNNPSSQIQDVVLVTFNDPNEPAPCEINNATTRLLQKTRDRNQLKRSLASIRAGGGKWCDECSITGVKLALDNSLPNSYMFVFTNASPRDQHLAEKVIRMAQSKGIQIIFVVPKSPCPIDDTYKKIASATSGQVLMCDVSDIDQILHFVDTFISGDGTVIVQNEVPANEATYVPFTIDDQTEYVVVSASGQNVQLDIAEGATKEYEKVTWTPHVKVIKIKKPAPGLYKAKVLASSNTTVRVFGRTDFTFHHGFSETETSSFQNDTRPPVEGTKYHLMISVHDPGESVVIKTAEILTKDRIVISEFPLRRKANNYYVTESFLTPNETFLIAIKGNGIHSGKEVKRISKTPIEPRLCDRDPVITIRQSGSLEYESELTLTCIVRAYPKPVITWRDGALLKGNIAEISKIDFVSELHIKELRKSQTYYCYAENNFGESFAKVDIRVKSPFIVSKVNEDVFVEYGESVKMYCDIVAPYPRTVVWYYQRDPKNPEKKVVKYTGKYSVTYNGAFLIIDSVKETEAGKYSCTSRIARDEDTNTTIVRNVIIKHVAPVMGSSKDLEVMKDNPVTIKCEIVKAYPHPTISWQFKKIGSSTFETIAGSENELKIQNAKLENSGNYKCIAENSKGSNASETKLTVVSPPKILSDENKLYRGVEGDAVLKIPCTVIGFPKPIISWSVNSTEIKTGEKYRIEENALSIKTPLTEDSNYYTCKAENEFGSDTKIFESYVSKNIEDNLGDVTYVYVSEGETKIFDCPKGRWFHEGIPIDVTNDLTLNNATTFDDGNYTCRINTKDGAESFTYIVDVGYPPRFERDGNEEHDWDGDEQFLDCAVYMKPDEVTTKIEWRYDGNLTNIGSSYYHPVIGWGNYSCKISNIHGQVTKQFYVFSSSCLIQNLMPKTPLILNESGKWPKLKTKGYLTSVPGNENIIMSCHNQNKESNFFQSLPNKSEVEASCLHEDEFLVDGKIYKFTDLQCKSDVRPVIKETGEKCANENTEIIKVGYDVNIINTFVELYRICFDKIKRVPIYSKVTLNNKPINVTPYRIYPWLPYEQYNRSQTLQDCDKYSKCCLKLNQLVQPLEVKGGPAESATFIKELNTVPMWTNCGHNVSWSAVETSLRSKIRLQRMEIRSGGHQYIDHNGVAVPRYLWKYVKPTPKSSVIVVQVNHPSPTEADILCRHECPADIPTDKYTYCCSAQEFERTFGVFL